MFTRLRHNAVITGHHQQGMVNTSDPRQHVWKETFRVGDVNKAQHAAIGLRPVGITDRWSYRAFLFRQAIGIHARDGLQQGGFPWST